MKLDRTLAIAASVGALLLVSSPVAHATSTGVTTNLFVDPAAGCNNLGCHSGGKTPAVSLSGPTLVAPNSTSTYSFTISSHGAQTHGGLNVSADDGDFTVGGPDAGNTQLLQNPSSLDFELTHTAPKPAASGVTTFSFNWTAPPAFGNVTLEAWGNSVNLNATSTGDAAAPTSLKVTNIDTVLCATAPPIATCANPGNSALVIKSGVLAKQGLTFVFSKGPTSDKADFGDPIGTADYAVCLYADGVLASDLDAPRGNTWIDKPLGFQLKDKTAPMLQAMTLAAGKTAGQAKILAKGKGLLGLSPTLPFANSTSVTVQVVNSQNTNCWAETYTSAMITRNIPGQFKAKR